VARGPRATGSFVEAGLRPLFDVQDSDPDPRLSRRPVGAEQSFSLGLGATIRNVKDEQIAGASRPTAVSTYIFSSCGQDTNAYDVLPTGAQEAACRRRAHCRA
jgi:hypothetical protein